MAIGKWWSLLQIDVKNVFLYGTLVEEVHMKPPSDTSSPHVYFATFSSTITQLGFTSNAHDYTLFT